MFAQSLLPLLLISLSSVLARPTWSKSKTNNHGSTDHGSTSTGTGTGTGTDTGTDTGVVMSGWYPGWLGSGTPPSQISWSKYNSMAFAFGIPTADPSVISLDANSQALLPTFVSEAKKNNVKALLSLGGWSGSQYFSSNVATESSRTAFVNAVVGLAQKYELDGIDFDWEYPGKAGSSLNGVSPDDSANFLKMLQQLKQTEVGQKLTITAAVSLSPFIGADGQPMADVSEFAKVIDYIQIMAYDIWGAWSTGVGPNAPLYDRCDPKQAGSVETAVDNWSSAKFPKNQIVVGVASYGRGFSVAPSASDAAGNFPAFDISQTPAGDSDTSTVPSSANSGLFNFAALVKDGYLTESGEAASGVTYHFHDCSQTPYLYKQSSSVMISYDDARSFASKGHYIKDQSLAGFAMWHVLGDTRDILLNAIHAAVQ